MEINCREVIQELSNYVEGDLDPILRAAIMLHLEDCDHCTAVLDGTQNILRLVCDDKVFPLPSGFSQRLFGRIMSQSLLE
ncbi:MAG TPA: zf-HC2 domain-containing protein [Terriglobales bacterium]|nr:zf-HC2 domain-containing protein [Terriglobales bacterium]